MKAEMKDGKLHLTIDCNDLKNLPQSSTGKTLIVATSGGNQATTINVNGKPLKIGVNAFISA